VGWQQLPFYCTPYAAIFCDMGGTTEEPATFSCWLMSRFLTPFPFRFPVAIYTTGTHSLMVVSLSVFHSSAFWMFSIMTLTVPSFFLTVVGSILTNLCKRQLMR